LTNDLGAFAGLLFEIGSRRLAIAGNAEAVLSALQEKSSKLAQRQHQEILQEAQDESEHMQAQHILIRIGRALNYKVFVARNDRHRFCLGESFAMLTTLVLPFIQASQEVMDTVSLIDVIWIDPKTDRIICAFEVEKSTSIYSGILRMKDLARSLPDQNCHFYLVAPDKRAHEVMAQLNRPAFKQDENFALGYLPFNALVLHCDALCTLADSHEVLKKIARFKFGKTWSVNR